MREAVRQGADEGSATPLAGRVAVVTGAAGGIGSAVARRLAAAGAAVALAGRERAALDRLAAELATTGARAAAIRCDVTDETSVKALAESAAGELGPVDLLVNNAGAAAAAPLAKIALADWNALLAVNATGPFLTARAFAPGMVERGFGRIVNVASVAGLAGAKYVAHYTAAKHALVGLTRALAAELAGTGVTAAAVAPGYVDTPMTSRTIEHIVARTGRSPEDARAAVLKSAGQSRLVAADEVAAAVLRLATQGGNGEIVVLTGNEAGDLPLEIVNPPALGEPHGWSHGIVAPPGARVLFVAGQAGWEADTPGEPPGFAAQFARACDKILEVVRAAGGTAQSVARLTIFVTDVEAWRADRRQLGVLWRERFGTYYPAMALVEVRKLVDRGALLEIEATAVLGGAPGS